MRKYPLKRKQFILLSGAMFMACIILLSASCKKKTLPPADFYGMVIADLRAGSSEGVMRRLKILTRDISNDTIPGISFVAPTGNLVSSIFINSRGEDQIPGNNHLKTVTDLFSQINIPFYPVMGSLDYCLESSGNPDRIFSHSEIQALEMIWRRYTGRPPYYSVIHNGWLFIFLNTVRSRSVQCHMDEEQLDWLGNALTQEKPAVLFMHRYPQDADEIRDQRSGKRMPGKTGSRFSGICSRYRDRIKGIFTGEKHSGGNGSSFDGIPVWTAGSFQNSEELPFLRIAFYQKDSTVQVIRESHPAE